MMPSNTVIDEDMLKEDEDEITAEIPTTVIDPPIFPLDIDELKVTFLISSEVELVKFNTPFNTKSAMVNGCWRSIVRIVEEPVETKMTMSDSCKSQIVVNVPEVVELGNSKKSPLVKLEDGFQFEELLQRPF